MYPKEGSTIRFIAGEDPIEGVIAKYGYDGYSGEETSFYLEDNPYMRYPIAFLSWEYTLIAPAPEVSTEDN